MSEQRDISIGFLPTVINVQGDLKRAKVTKESVPDKVRERLIKSREQILKLPSQEDGMDMTRVYAYRDRHGLPQQDIRVLSPSDFAKAVEISNAAQTNEAPVLSPSDSAKAVKVAKTAQIGHSGRYLVGEDITIVKRDLEYERLNGGPAFTESNLIHEIAHGNRHRLIEAQVTTQRRLLRTDKVDYRYKFRRTGFGVEKDKGNYLGAFLEEGYPEFERGIYITQELGLSSGFVGRIVADLPRVFDKYLTKYIYHDQLKIGIAPGAGIAAILELVAERDPEFLSVLRESRRSVEGLREVAKRLDAVSPGLYLRLRNLNILTEGTSDIETMYQNIRDAIQAKDKPQQ